MYGIHVICNECCRSCCFALQADYLCCVVKGVHVEASTSARCWQHAAALPLIDTETSGIQANKTLGVRCPLNAALKAHLRHLCCHLLTSIVIDPSHPACV